MTIPIDYSVLTNYYQAREGIASNASGSGASASSSSGSTSTAHTVAVTPPWSAKGASTAASILATKVLNGQNIINPNAALTDVKGASVEYKSLFTLYQGLNALEGMTQQMQLKTATATGNAKLSAAFDSGLVNVTKYLNSLTLPKIRLSVGQVFSSAVSTAGPATEDDTYKTNTIFIGAQDDSVPAFQGDVQFSINVTKYTGQKVAIPIDLSQMGSTTRSMPNVTNFINSQLQAAGIATRFADANTPGQPQVIKAGTKSITLPAGPDHWAWSIKGDSIETVSFSAPSTAAAVYVAQTAGNVSGYADQTAADTAAAAAAAAQGKTVSAAVKTANDVLSAPVQQLMKFQTDQSSTATPPPAALVQPGSTNTVAGEALSKTLASTVGSVQATATGADGSVYVLANITGATDGQAIQGNQDVALQKYDSVGNLVYTQTLGAAQSANGLSLAVSADGKVAVGGSFTGALDANTPGNGKQTTDSFVTLYDAQGQELWTKAGTAINNNQVKSVAFGADGSIYAAGQANYSTDAVAASGQSKGFVTGYSAAGKTLFNVSTGATDASSLALDGNTLVVAGTNSGDAVLNSYTLQPTGAPTLNATRDLGALQGGSIAGVAINNGQVVIAGTTMNGSLSAGAVTAAASGGKQAFVAQMSESLSAAPTDQIAYFGGGGGTSTTATALTVANGKIYIAGSSNTALPNMPKIGAVDGYVAAVDLSTGTMSWNQRYTALDGHAAPESIAVASNGASVLDRLGLPSQTLQYTANSQLLTSATSVRAGESFQVRTGQGATPVTVKIEATDTPQTLVTKIERASGFTAKVSVISRGGQSQVQIKAANANSTIELLPGPAGQDALSALGIDAGVVQNAPSLSSGSKSTSTHGVAANTYGLNIDGRFDLSTPDGIKAAQKTIQTAMAKVQTAYYGLVNGNQPASTKPAITGKVPAYIQAQLANYQAGLSRLSGSNSATSSSTGLASLFG